MADKLKPIRTKADYKKALAEIERLWGAKSRTPRGDRLDVLATLIDAYESEHYPMAVAAVCGARVRSCHRSEAATAARGRREGVPPTAIKPFFEPGIPNTHKSSLTRMALT